jgi:hypothetical protein
MFENRQPVADVTPSCMEHALHLAAKHFVEGVAPTSSTSLLQKVKGAMANATRDDTAIDLDALNSEIGGIEAAMGHDAEEEDEEYDVADTIGKALALVTQV